MAQPGGLFPSAEQWRQLRTAWAEREHNPVLHYFRLARQRRKQATPRKHRMLLFLFVWSLVALTAALVSDQHAAWNNQWRNNWVPELFGLGAGLALLCVLWLAQGLFEAISTAACLLSQPSRRKLDLQLDAPLAASRLGAADLLVGLIWPILHPLLPRLGAAASLACIGIIAAASQELWGYGGSTRLFGLGHLLVSDGTNLTLLWLDTVLERWQQALLLVPFSLFGVYTCGVLACCILLLLALCAGRGIRMDVHAGVLASLYTLGALFFAWFSQMLTEMLRYQYGNSHVGVGQLALAALEPLPLLVCLATLFACIRLPLLAGRAGVALSTIYALPLLFVASCAGLFWLATSTGFNGVDPTHHFTDLFLSWSMFAPVSAIAVPHPICFGTGLSVPLSHLELHQFRWPFLILGQLTLLCGLLRAALDSIAAAREAGAQ